MRGPARQLIEARLAEADQALTSRIDALLEISERQLLLLNQLNSELTSDSTLKTDIANTINQATDLKRSIESLRSGVAAEPEPGFEEPIVNSDNTDQG
jgi:hypothetical protein